MSKQTGRIALCGMLCGLSVMIIMLSGVLDSLAYAIPMAAGALLIVPVIEFGAGTAFTTYAAAAILSMILLPRDGPLMYLFLFGLYPIVKVFFERIPSRLLEYLCKFAFFNVTASAAVAVSVFVLGIPLDDGGLGRWLIPALLAAGNLAFIFYDRMLTLCVTLYLRRLQPLLHKALHIK